MAKKNNGGKGVKQGKDSVGTEDERCLEVAKDNLTRQGWVLYRNIKNNIWDSVRQGLVVKIEKGKSYFIFPLVEGSEKDADAIREYCKLEDIEQPTITIGDDEYKLNGFRVEEKKVVIIHEDWTVALTFAEFVAAVTTIQNIRE